jgi:ribose transport system permease protein
MNDALPNDTARAASPTPAKAITARSIAFIALQRYGLLVLFVASVIVFSVLLPDSFASVLNFRNIAGNQAVLAIVSLAAIIPLICGHFDLSIGAVLGLTSIATSALLSEYSAPLWIAVPAGIALGGLIGLVNGVLIAKLHLNALITTLGVATVITGLVTLYTDGQSIITGIPTALTDIGSGVWLGLPCTLYFLFAVALFTWYLLEHTPFGRYLHAVGSNANAARLVGLKVDRIVVQSFVVSGLLVGLGGVLQVARQGGGNPQVGLFFMMPALSAAFLGATSIHPGRFNVPGTILAVFFLATSVSGLSLFGVDNWVEAIFNGTALVVAVALSTVLSRRQAGQA